MRCVILAVVLLVIAADVTGLEFGDIIYYEPKTPKTLPSFKYRHVAVYVDNHQFDGRTEGHTIFERLNAKDSCVFSKPDLKSNPVICNFLDGYVDENGEVYEKGTVAEMEGRIKELRTTCGKYNVLTNNCEHLATYVRYGKKIAMQEGLSGKGLAINEHGVKRLHMLKFIKKQRQEKKLTCNIPLTE